MASQQQTTEELLSLSMSGQENFVPAAEEARPHTFLILAPTTSAPKPTVAATPMTDAEAKARRSSSMSSNTSNGQKRFLKLGAGEGDWSEEVVVE